MDTEIRTRFLTPSSQTIYRAVTTTDGKRRIAEDDLGTIKATRHGWRVDIPGVLADTFPDRDDALAAARRHLGES